MRLHAPDSNWFLALFLVNMNWHQPCHQVLAPNLVMSVLLVFHFENSPLVLLLESHTFVA